MSFYKINKDKVVSDFESHYLSTSTITFDLYRMGLQHFYKEDIEIPNEVHPKYNFISAQKSDVTNHEKNTSILIGNDTKTITNAILLIDVGILDG